MMIVRLTKSDCAGLVKSVFDHASQEETRKQRVISRESFTTAASSSATSITKIVWAAG